jgi:alpha-tubulin suppressor-like RCC1 family protein
MGPIADGVSPPVLVPGVNNAVAIAAEGEFTCALLQSGSVECWGNDFAGELGHVVTLSCQNSQVPCSDSPVAVSGVTNATAISAQGDFTCALLKGGTVQCWGSNSGDELGNTSQTTCQTDNSACSVTPVAVGGVAGATAISAGGEHACAVLQTGNVSCWGYNGSGQLGTGIMGAGSTAASVAW